MMLRSINTSSMEIFSLWNVLEEQKHVVIRLFKSRQDAENCTNILDSRAYSTSELDSVEKIETETKAFIKTARAELMRAGLRTEVGRRRERERQEDIVGTLKESEPQVPLTF